ncbi:serine hydrolase domain-containing protein [Maritalea porphyrae]|uniref:6-aminohexanoate-dimer hydrolase n=1 Tax=Maritalea porphyrae TaxID=880732 RepID=A0ABQ5UQW6_9HYPH|nr:serine hydrolase [Maritalea porphyrae]GLQ17593.1 6-aminohexanoate-dimer hydrolase [Maritalea porphyrae]
MRWFGFAIKGLLGLFVFLVIVVVGYLFIAPPDMLRVATNYSAKIVCSNVFLAGRDPVEVQNIDVQAGGHPILGYINVEVDEPKGVVTARMLGLFATGSAVYRDGLGCASAPDGNLEAVKQVNLADTQIEKYTQLSDWPMGPNNIAVDNILVDEELVGPAMRAVVVIKDGKLIGETYGSGFDAETPLLGWSMTKTVTALLLGAAFENNFDPEMTELFDNWHDDIRSNLSLGTLMSMSSGLQWNEGYGSVSDVTRMLYLEPDMAAFAASLPIDNENAPKRFHYSSGTTVLLSRIWQDHVGDKALALPHEKLFGPLGMRTATLETDAAGTYAGSSYLYASARDWARIGQLIANKGVWAGKQLVNEEYLSWMVSPAATSMAAWGRAKYGNGQIWLHGPSRGVAEGIDPDAGFDLPLDTRWLLGHDGQAIAIIPSKGLVVVRMGLTPSNLGYRPQAMVSAILDATGS